MTKIAKEDEFKAAHGELAAMLPQIAEGLSDEAGKKLDPALVDQSHQALKMIEKYVPKELRQENRMSDIEASLGIASRKIARSDELKKTVAAMRKAVKALKTADAYAASGAVAAVSRSGRRRRVPGGDASGFPGAADAGQGGCGIATGRAGRARRRRDERDPDPTRRENRSAGRGKTRRGGGGRWGRLRIGRGRRPCALAAVRRIRCRSKIAVLSADAAFPRARRRRVGRQYGKQ